MRKLILVLLALVAASSADAANWRFRYLSDIGSFAGTLEGSLQADGNTVLVAAVADFVSFKGVPLASYPFLTTGSSLYGVPRAPSVTIDGSNLDFLACTDEFCGTDGFGFDPDTIEFTPSLITAIPTDGFEFGYRESADSAKWRLSLVPEPASWLMLITGFGFIGAMARRRSAATVAS